MEARVRAVKIEPDSEDAFHAYARASKMAAMSPRHSKTGAPTGRSGPANNAVSDLGEMVKVLDGAVTSMLRTNPALRDKADGWRRRLKSIYENASKEKNMVIAVLGASGAGKSWLINALLGDHIVPTSGMDACTSMPIEVSYHSYELVHSQIDFISRSSWLEEINILISALKDVCGVPSQLAEDGQEAWARAHVVYPDLMADDFMNSSAEEIIDGDEYIAGQLGKTIEFYSSPVDFETELRNFTKTHRPNVALWPVIARVRVRCDCAVLENGLTLVDLPGMSDSNQARALIYEQYLQKCDHAFIVAPIKRAATDHIARELLGRAFKAQFLMDQKYTAECVTFIATGNDDIACKEIVTQLEIEWADEWQSLEIEDHDLQTRIRSLRKEIDALYLEKSVLDTRGSRRPLKSASRKSGAVDGIELNIRISQSQADCDMLGQRKSENERKKKLFCAQRRGEWSREVIQRDFRNGLDDLCDDPESEGDTEDIGDINVFSVSAQDYLKLIGKSPTDGSVSTFQSTTDTAIPGLIQYCRTLGQKRIMAAKEKNGVKLSDLVEHIRSYLSQAAAHSERDRTNLRALWTRLLDLNRDFQPMNTRSWIHYEVVWTCQASKQKIMHSLASRLVPDMQVAAQEAGEEVADRIHTLGRQIMYWQTIKAIFRRNGIWKHHDWNSVAVELLQRRIAVSWARVLGGNRLNGDIASIEERLRIILARMRDAAPNHLRPRVEQCIEKAMQLAKTHAQNAIQERRHLIKESQQNMSRGMSKKIAAQLQPLYHRAMACTGKGAKVRALELIREGLEERSDTLFTSAVNETAKTLRLSLAASLDEHIAAMAEIANVVESQMSLLWAGGTQETSSAAQAAVDRALQVISERMAEYLEH